LSEFAEVWYDGAIGLVIKAYHERLPRPRVD